MRVVKICNYIYIGCPKSRNMTIGVPLNYDIYIIGQSINICVAGGPASSK